MPLILLRSLLILVSLISVFGANRTQDDFKPLTGDLSFRAIFKLRRVEQGKCELENEVYELYDSEARAASIWLRTKEAGLAEVEQRRFVYLGQDVEIVEEGENLLDLRELDKVDKGYDPIFDRSDTLLDEFEPIKVLSHSGDLFQLLLGFKTESSSPDISAFLDVKCKQQVNLKLEYIRGLSGLLHLIECRREEFKRLSEQKGRIGSGPAIFTFEGEPVGGTKYPNQNISISNLQTIVLEVDSSEQNLPSRIIPSKISLEFKNGIQIFISVHKFDKVDVNSGINFDEFLIPPGRGYSKTLTPTWSKLPLSSVPHQSSDGFSFRASLSGPSLPLKFPVEQVVSFDDRMKLLAFQKTIIQGHPDSTGIKRVVTREVLDGQTGLKFHIMHSNNDHLNQPDVGPSNRYFWRSCAASSISRYSLEQLETGHDTIFDTFGASFMGYASVRGVLCRVYEKRIYVLPPWLGLGDDEMYEFSKRPFDLYAVSYISASNLLKKDAGALMRIELRALESSGQNMRLVWMIDVEVFSFHYKVGLSDFEEGSNLFSITDECLLSDPNLTHIDLMMSFKPYFPQANDTATQALLNLMKSSPNLQTSVLMNSLKSLDIARIQQSSLISLFDSEDNLRVSLTVNELPQVSSSVKILGFATDMSTWFENSGYWSVGASSSSMADCEFRALHTLDPYQTSFDAKNRQIYMFCPKSMHCVLIDKEITPGTSLDIDSVLSYSKNTTTGNCVLAAIEIDTPESRRLVKDADKSGKSLLKFTDQSYRDQLRSLPISMTLLNKASSSDKRENQLTMLLKHLEISQLKTRFTNDLTNRLRGFTYQYPEDVEPIELISSAQCSRLCNMHHECKSYSLCHREYDSFKFDCLLSRVNWTDQDSVRAVTNLFDSPDVHESVDATIVVDMDIGKSNSVEVKFIKSNLCSIHLRRVSSLFELKYSQGLTETYDKVHLLHAEDVEQCADFCLNRASFINQVKGNTTFVDQNFRGEACVGFKYGVKLSTCEMIPQYDLYNLTQQLDMTLHKDKAASWVAAFDLDEPGSGTSRKTEIHLYRLNYEQVFTNHHKTSKVETQFNEKEEAGISREIYTPSDCALHCLQNRLCQSFDVMPIEPGFKFSCIMYPSSGYRNLESVKSQHYEPTELAYHLTGSRWLDEERTDASGVYIDVKLVDQVAPDQDSNRWTAKNNINSIRVPTLAISALLILAAILLGVVLYVRDSVADFFRLKLSSRSD